MLRQARPAPPPLVFAMSVQKEFEEQILLGNKSLFLSSLGKTKEKIIKNSKI